MSETDLAATPVASGAGALLRAAREQAGVHIASLAVALKVPVSRLEALEADRYDLLPDPPFVRALAGSVCRALKLNPAPVLALLPQKTPSRLGADVPRTDGATFRTKPATSAGLAGLGGLGRSLRHPVVWVVGILLLAAAALLLVPSARLGEWMQAVVGSGTTDSTSSPLDAAPETATQPSEPPVAAVAPMGPESSRTPGNGVDASPQPSPSLQSSGMLTSSAGAADAAAPTAVSTPSEGLLSFTASAESWVRVSDSRGATVFEKLLKPGLPQSTNGTPPLTVVVGNARATDVQVRGQAFDLSAITRNNVARFEVR